MIGPGPLCPTQVAARWRTDERTGPRSAGPLERRGLRALATSLVLRHRPDAPAAGSVVPLPSSRWATACVPGQPQPLCNEPKAGAARYRWPGRHRLGVGGGRLWYRPPGPQRAMRPAHLISAPLSPCARLAHAWWGGWHDRVHCRRWLKEHRLPAGPPEGQTGPSLLQPAPEAIAFRNRPWRAQGPTDRLSDPQPGNVCMIPTASDMFR